jgi:hypothetical protein
MPRNNYDLDKDLFAEPARPEAPGNSTDQTFVRHRASDYPRMDVTQPSQFRLAVRHISNVHGMAGPEDIRAGREWYPRVHVATQKGARHLGVSPLHAAGLVAAVSPNMDFERNNIGAFHEMGSLSPKAWETIRRSATATKAGPYHQRTPEATDILRGTSLSVASDSALLRAHRLMEGEDPEEVMSKRTGPKTHSFMHAIHDPSSHEHGITIDARAHDIAQNEMWPWTYTGRGISSADLPSSRRVLKSGEPAKSFGKKTRYEHFEDAYRTSADIAGEHPHDMQAITWMTGKKIEKSFPTKSGAPRKFGVARHRQPYT